VGVAVIPSYFERVRNVARKRVRGSRQAAKGVVRSSGLQTSSRRLVLALNGRAGVNGNAQASTGARAERARRRERDRAQATTGARVERACKHQRACAAAGARMELARKHELARAGCERERA